MKSQLLFKAILFVSLNLFFFNVLMIKNEFCCH